MRETFVGTWALVRLGVRRDRWSLPVWVLVLAGMAGSAASAVAGVYPDKASRVEAANVFNATASVVAMFGRVYDPTSIGALAMIKYTAFMAAAVAVVMVIFTVRHTRGEEETGRLELVSGGRLGRNAPLTAALIITFGASLALGVATAFALVAAGLPTEGSWAFGLGWAAVGMTFSAIAAVGAQIANSARTATGFGTIAIAAAYLLRAAGDLATPGPSVLSWLSPIGWNQQIRAYAGDRFWVLAFPVALCVVFVPVAFVLRGRRDLGSGMRADRRGPATGRLSTVGGLAVRLQDRVFAAWAATVVVFGLLIGSLVNTVNDFLSSSIAQDLIKKLGGTTILVDAFLAAEISILGLIVAAYGLAAANRLRSEETVGHTEAILGTAATRLRWATSHVLAALGGVAALMLLAGLSIGTGAAVALKDWSQVWPITLATLASVPAAWVVVSLVVAAFGWVPRLTGAVWGVLFAFIALGEFGVLWHAPQWLMDLSPFQHSPRMPLDSGAVTPVVFLTLVAAALTAFGYVGWRRRDLAP